MERESPSSVSTIGKNKIITKVEIKQKENG